MASTVTLYDRQRVGYNVQEVVDSVATMSSACIADINALQTSASACKGAVWFSWGQAADTAASSATSETIIDRVVAPGAVTTAWIVPSSTLTAATAGYATITLSKRDGAGGGAISLASVTTSTVACGGTGSWAAFTPVSLGTITSGAVTSGNILTYTVSKTGTGVSIPAWEIQVQELLT